MMLKHWKNRRELDFILMQEARFRPGKPFILPEFSYCAAANLHIDKVYFGVMTASIPSINRSTAYLSQNREILIGPKKSFLLTTYDIEPKQELMIINIHGLNFRGLHKYAAELDYVKKIASNHVGPLIIAGDFNSWSQSRSIKLKKFKKELGLNIVAFCKTSNIKSFRGHCLDAIFYRGLDLVSADTEHHYGLSDHTPLFAKFNIPNHAKRH
jgi:endonuclease/exonuclease/phosphatase (EEP) superfamily protein YafD